MRYNGNVLLRLAGSVLLGVAAAILFLSAASGLDARAAGLVLASLVLALAAACAFVVRDARPYLATINAPAGASVGPEEGKRAAEFLARAPDRIAAVALVAGVFSVWLGELLHLVLQGMPEDAGLAAPAVAGLLGGFVAATSASAFATQVTSQIRVAASIGDAENLGLGIGDRILLYNGGAAIVGLLAFGLVIRADLAADNQIGILTYTAGLTLSASLAAAAWLSARTVQSAMASLVREVQQVASGDLTRSVAPPGGGEVAQLAGALTRMSASLKQILNNIKSVSSEVAAASEDIAVSSSTMAGKIKDQASAVESIAGAIATSTRAMSDIAERTDALGLAAEKSSSSIVEMMASIRSVAENAEQLRVKGDDSGESLTRILRTIEDVSKGAEQLFQLAERSSQAVKEIDGGVAQISESLKASRALAEVVAEEARAGGDAVRSLILAVEEIQEQVDSVAGVIANLDRKSWEISNVLEVITDIADQTSLLALNAAIIAAQAGERGKGFAVIADEIKGLADRTGAATKEIGRVIREVKKDVAGAGQGMEQTQKKAAEGVALSQQADKALAQIISSAAASKDRIAVIAGASEQTSGRTREIVAAAVGVARVAGELRSAVGAQGKAGQAAAERAAVMRGIALEVARAMEEQATASRTIVEAVQSSLAMVQGITVATGAQKKEALAIETSLAQVRTSAIANQESVADLERVVQTLIQEAVVLRHEIDRFKTVESKKRKTGFDE
ncbi:MAG TPA: methyl-accepting chemotaxis protein [bacterium]|nr:methyl-accepting chemotaxis protein [bacterium]